MMATLAPAIFAYLVNALWQLPLVYAGAWLAARMVGGRRAQWEHNIWSSALVLAVALPACGDLLLAWLAWAWRVLALALRSEPPKGNVTITFGVTNATAGNAHSLPPMLLEVASAAYLAALLFFASRLAWSLARTWALQRRARALELGAPSLAAWQRCARHFHVADALVAESAEVFGPVTVGVRHRTLLLPAEWATSVAAADLEAAFAHEFAHMRRHDFAKNLLLEICALPVAWHPLLPLVRARIAESREIVCDAMAADALDGRIPYAHSLLRLASTLAVKPSPTLHAIGIFDSHSFERRLMQLNRSVLSFSTQRRLLVAAACAALACGVCGSALAFRVKAPAMQTQRLQPPSSTTPAQVTALNSPALSLSPSLPALPSAPATVRSAPPLNPVPSMPQPAPAASAEASPAATVQEPSPAPAAAPTGRARISAGVMDGAIMTKVDPVYPDIARAAKVEGSVVLHALIGKDGTVRALEAISGPQMLRGAALEAVRQWTYHVYMLNGEPTEVDTTITVTFSLNP